MQPRSSKELQRTRVDGAAFGGTGDDEDQRKGKGGQDEPPSALPGCGKDAENERGNRDQEEHPRHRATDGMRRRHVERADERTGQCDDSLE